jgi:aqualysin 1
MKKTNLILNTLVVLSLVLSLLSSPAYLASSAVYAQDGSTSTGSESAQGQEQATAEPTAIPTEEPTAVPTEEPTAVPTDVATTEPSVAPTDAATTEPTQEATQSEATATPTSTSEVTATPTVTGTTTAVVTETATPTSEATATPSVTPTTQYKLDTNDLDNRYIVVYKDGVDKKAKLNTLTASINSEGGSVLFDYSSNVLNGFAAAIPSEMVDEIKKDADVDYVEKDSLVTLDAVPAAHTDDTRTTTADGTWGLQRINVRALADMSNYDYDYDGSGVNVYLIDSGINSKASDLTPANITNEYDTTGDGYTGYCSDSTSDGALHGTRVADVIAGTDLGVAPGVKLHNIRAFGCSGTSTVSKVVAAVSYVTLNHDDPAVANMSFSSPSSSSLITAVKKSITYGVTYVAAAGDEGASAGGYSPANVSTAITVGATKTNTINGVDWDERYTSSNYGSYIDVFAPGYEIAACDSATCDTATPDLFTGTSMSAAFTTGAVALYLEEFGTTAPATVASAIVYNSTKSVIYSPSIGTSSANRLLYVHTVPAIPTLETPAAGATVSTTTPTFSWDAVTDADSYWLEVSIDKSFTDTSMIINTTGITTTSSTPASGVLYTGKTYYWRVAGLSSYNVYGSWSTIRTLYVGTPAVTLTSPIGNAVGATIVRSLPTFKWNKIASAAQYYVQYTDDTSDTSFSSATLSSALTTNSYTPSSSSFVYGSYLWRVYSCDEATSAPESDCNVSDYSTFDYRPNLPKAPSLSSPAASLIDNENPALKWSAASYASTYEVEISTNSSFPAGEIIESDDSATSPYTITTTLPDVAGGTRYYWHVRGLNSWTTPEVGPWSTTRYFTIDKVAPSTPSLTSPTDGSTVNGIPTFKWNSASGAKAYQLRFATDIAFSANLTTTGEITSTSYKPSYITAATYYWQVRARDAYGNWSNDWTTVPSYNTVTITAAKPAAPSLSSPSNAAELNNDSDDITLDWNDVAFATSFNVQVATASSFSASSLVLDDTSSTSPYTISSGTLTNGKTYYWRIQSVGSVGTSGWSSVRNFKVDNIAPTNLTLKLPTDNNSIRGKLTFTWSASGANYYNFYYTDGSSLSSTPYKSNLTATSYSISSPNTGDHVWAVEACDKAGNCVTSDTRTVTTLYPILSAPTLVDPAKGEVINTQTPTFEWSTVTNNDGYALQYSAASNFSTKTDATIATGLTTYTPTDDLPTVTSGSTTYYWRMATINKDGTTGTFGASRTFVLDIAGPNPISLSYPTTGTKVRDTTPTFKWNANNGSVKYDLQYSTDESFTTNTQVSGITKTSYTPTTALTIGTTTTPYYWRVKGYDAAGNAGDWTVTPAMFYVYPVTPSTPTLTALTPPSSYTTYATNLSSTDDSTPLLSWKAVTDATSYDVKIGTASDFATTTYCDLTFLVSDSEGPSTSYFEHSIPASFTCSNFTTLTPGTKYYWKVKAINAADEASSFSSSRSFTLYPLIEEDFSSDDSAWDGVTNISTSNKTDKSTWEYDTTSTVTTLHADPSPYNYSFATYAGSTYDTVGFQARIKRDLYASSGSTKNDAPFTGILIRGTVNGTYGYVTSGYLFGYEVVDEVGCYKVSKYTYDITNKTSTETNLAYSCSDDNTQKVLNIDGYNVIRVSASGNSMGLYINDTLIYTLTDSTYSSGQLGLAFFSPKNYTTGVYYADSATIGKP